MSGKSSRTKGASGEREFAHLLDELVGCRLTRNLEQSRRGGHDLIPDPEDTGPVAQELARYAIEIKRHAKATPALLRNWWTQATEQAQRVGLVPCLAYRQDRGSWRVCLPLSVLQPSLEPWEGHEWTADVSLPAFAALVREAAG